MTGSMAGCAVSRMPLSTRHKSSGFTLMELLISVVLISVFAAVLIDRLLYYQERAEKAAVEYVLETVRMGMRLRMAELMIGGRGHEIPAMTRDNPMNWMDKTPSGYVGEYRDPKPGHWYFAAKSGELIYLPVNRRYLAGVGSDIRELRFKISVTGRPSGNVGLALQPVVPYRWF